MGGGGNDDDAGTLILHAGIFLRALGRDALKACCA